MRIVQLANFYGPRSGGLRTALNHLGAGYQERGHEVVLIDTAQVNRFAGNVLELESRAGEPLLTMSAAAAEAFTQAQRKTIERHAQIVSAPIGNIELCAGGSVRCMLAEIHLPRKS